MVCLCTLITFRKLSTILMFFKICIEVPFFHHFICRMVNAILEEELKEIHAFSQKTLTTEQWEKSKN